MVAACACQDLDCLISCFLAKQSLLLLLPQVFDYKNVVVEAVHLNKWAGVHFIVSACRAALCMPACFCASPSWHASFCLGPPPATTHVM